MANDRDREVLSRLMQAYDESFGERCSDRTVQEIATYREEIEARYAGVVEALEAVVRWRDGQEGPEILFTEGAKMMTTVRTALAKIGRG